MGLTLEVPALHVSFVGCREVAPRSSGAGGERGPSVLEEPAELLSFQLNLSKMKMSYLTEVL